MVQAFSFLKKYLDTDEPKNKEILIEKCIAEQTDNPWYWNISAAILLPFMRQAHSTVVTSRYRDQKSAG